MVSLSMTLSDPWPGFQGHGSFKRRISAKRHILQTQLLYRTLVGNHRQAIDRQASYIQHTTPLLLHKPCKRFASVARVCQRQLAFLVLLDVSRWDLPSFKHTKIKSTWSVLTIGVTDLDNTVFVKLYRFPDFSKKCGFRMFPLVYAQRFCKKCIRAFSKLHYLYIVIARIRVRGDGWDLGPLEQNPTRTKEPDRQWRSSSFQYLDI